MPRTAPVRVTPQAWEVHLLIAGVWTVHSTALRACEAFAAYHANDDVHRRLLRNGRVLIDTTTEQLALLSEGA